MEYNPVIDRVQAILIADSQTHDFFYVPKAHFCDCHTRAAVSVMHHISIWISLITQHKEVYDSMWKMKYNPVIDRVQSILIADSQTHDFFSVAATQEQHQ